MDTTKKDTKSYRDMSALLDRVNKQSSEALGKTTEVDFEVKPALTYQQRVEAAADLYSVPQRTVNQIFKGQVRPVFQRRRTLKSCAKEHDVSVNSVRQEVWERGELRPRDYKDRNWREIVRLAA